MSEKVIENRTKWVSSVALPFLDHHVLADVSFNGHCVINNICIPIEVINI